MTNCASYLCDNKATVEKLCPPCHASERLVLAINAAIEEYLNACWSTSDLPRRVPALVSHDIAHATAGFGGPLVDLLSLGQGRNVYVTSGAWLDGWMTPPRWYGGLAWDISEDQTDYSNKEGTPA